MKVLIVSDTHGRDENLEWVVSYETPIDAMIHCGDIEGSEDYFEALLDCPVYMVRGNNDFFSDLNSEIVIELAGKRIMVTHGHYYGVSMGPERLIDEGMSRDIDIIMFGHTHRPFFLHENDIIVLNPGSLSYPRQSGREPSYIIMEIDEKNNFNFFKKVVDN